MLTYDFQYVFCVLTRYDLIRIVGLHIKNRHMFPLLAKKITITRLQWLSNWLAKEHYIELQTGADHETDIIFLAGKTKTATIDYYRNNTICDKLVAMLM